MAGVNASAGTGAASAGSPSAGGNGGATAGEAGHGGAMAGASSGADPGGTSGSAGAVSAMPTWQQEPFIMDTWFWADGVAPAEALSTVKASGFSGFALSVGHDVAGHLQAAAQSGVQIVGIWTPVNLGESPTGVVDSVAGTGAAIWLSLNGATPSDASQDDAALSIITALADECAAKGLPGVALYPHVGFWLERVGDAVRLAQKAARPDVGVVFNQYHWMTAEAGSDLSATLEAAKPYLKVVTLNGSEQAPSILPLGTGSYDVAPLFDAISALPFSGHAGLQGYSISGDIPGKLSAAKTAWDSQVTQANAKR